MELFFPKKTKQGKILVVYLFRLCGLCSVRQIIDNNEERCVDGCNMFILSHRKQKYTCGRVNGSLDSY